MEGLDSIVATIKNLDETIEDLERARVILFSIVTDLKGGEAHASYSLPIEGVPDDKIKPLVLLMQQIGIVCEGGQDEITFTKK